MAQCVITVDGPNGTGKQTFLDLLEAELRGQGYKVFGISTGHLYRAVAWLALRLSGNDTDTAKRQFPNGESAVAMARRCNLALVGTEVHCDDGVIRVTQLKRIDVSRLTPFFATTPEVRAWCDPQFQQEAAKLEGIVVIDGRDVGTAVMPRADAKLYLTARPEVQAERQGDTLEHVLARDAQDADNLAPAKDAYVIDTSDLEPEEVFDLALAGLRQRLDWLEVTPI